jgi:hypothetical protein
VDLKVDMGVLPRLNQLQLIVDAELYTFPLIHAILSGSEFPALEHLIIDVRGRQKRQLFTPFKRTSSEHALVLPTKLAQNLRSTVLSFSGVAKVNDPYGFVKQFFGEAAADLQVLGTGAFHVAFNNCSRYSGFILSCRTRRLGISKVEPEAIAVRWRVE